MIGAQSAVSKAISEKPATQGVTLAESDNIFSSVSSSPSTHIKNTAYTTNDYK